MRSNQNHCDHPTQESVAYSCYCPRGPNEITWAGIVLEKEFLRANL